MLCHKGVSYENNQIIVTSFCSIILNLTEAHPHTRTVDLVLREQQVMLSLLLPYQSIGEDYKIEFKNIYILQ